MATATGRKPVSSVEASDLRTILMRKVSRIGVRTLSVNNHGCFFIRLQNRRNDVEYQIPATRVPLWLKQLEGELDVQVS